jgi:hypothetical protein
MRAPEPSVPVIDSSIGKIDVARHFTGADVPAEPRPR